MNKRLPEMPTLTSDAYAAVMPLWLVNALRVFSLLFSLGAAWLGFQDWATIPLFAKVIICILAPTFFFLAISSKKGWALYATNPFFLADSSGMYFRHKDALTTFIGNNNQDKREKSKQWLFVPWHNISNIRVGMVSSSDGYSAGAVFDVYASAEEVVAFFYEGLKDKQPLQAEIKAVCFYQNAAPGPKKVVAHLQEMLNRYKKSPLRAKYERTTY